MADAMARCAASTASGFHRDRGDAESHEVLSERRAVRRRLSTERRRQPVATGPLDHLSDGIDDRLAFVSDQRV